MRADDLDHKELLELDPDAGVIRFAGQRALLLDAVAMRLLRKYLVENFGITAARTVLTQFGFAHGWRMAEAMRAEFTWETDEEWRRAGTRIRADHRGERLRKGAGRPAPPRGVHARGRPVHRGQLRRHHGDAPRERAVRTRARCGGTL